MKIIKFLGGLGNQMFQYALYRSMQKRFPAVKADLQGFKDYSLHNGYELERIFGIKVSQISPFASKLYNTHNRQWYYRKIRRVLKLKDIYRREKKIFAFDPSVFIESTSKYYWGYWQNLKYFEDVPQELRTDFSFNIPLAGDNLQMLELIKHSNSISIHVRRGDYLNDLLLGGLCGPDYYKQAIDYIQSSVASPSFFIFSDDIPWCTENLNLDDCSFISWNKGTSSHIDMQLMSACKHNIIANSSFSWWAAWLNPNRDKIVIGPKKWVNDSDPNASISFPQNWISF